MSLGFGQTVRCTAQQHDHMIAFTSQLAHVVSSAYIKSPEADKHNGYSAGSYKDLTRVARLNETMWSELFLCNAEPLAQEIDEIIKHLDEYRKGHPCRRPRGTDHSAERRTRAQGKTGLIRNSKRYEKGQCLCALFLSFARIRKLLRKQVAERKFFAHTSKILRLSAQSIYIGICFCYNLFA